jgi:hypothetical protein
VSNAIVAALEQAAERIGKSLSSDAKAAVEKMYRDVGRGAEKIVERVGKADAEHASHFLDLAEHLGAHEAEQNVDKAAVSAARRELATELNPGGTGLSTRAEDAIRKLENVKHDPLGDINKLPNHNHYSAARIEAAGQVVARKADGTAFSHISDLQQAHDALGNVRKVLRQEISQPPPTLTERGAEVLARRDREAIRLQRRTLSFLQSIGHGNFPPYHKFP